MNLYKYISWRPFDVECQHDKNCEYTHKCYSRDNLLNSQLYFNSAKSFNDPFDLSPFFDTNATPEQILEKAIEAVKITTGLEGNKALREAKKLISIRKIGSKKSLNQAISGQKSLLYQIGVCCFSSAGWDNLLMWSHYAEKHTGICLEFFYPLTLTHRIPSNSEFHPIFHPKPVTYDENMSQINIFITTGDELTKCLTKKSPEWKYEAEYRSMCLDYIGPIRYDPWQLKSITAGTRMEDKEFNELASTIKKLKYQPHLYRARKKEREYGVERIEVIHKTPPQ